MKSRLTEAEFEELKRKRDEAAREWVRRICAEHGWDPEKAVVNMCGSGVCYCACPDGPCQHTWDGPKYYSDDGCVSSATCSRCGTVAIDHDMRYGP